MRIVIADDEHLVRFSLRSMIEELHLGLTVVAEATDGESLLDALARFQPDLCFVDIRMPGLSGLGAMKKAGKVGHRVRWVILTGHAEFDYAKEALELGASAYLLKPAGPSQISEVLMPLVKAFEKEKVEKSIRFGHVLLAALGSPNSQVAVPRISAAWLVSLRCDTGTECTPQERSDFPAQILTQIRGTAQRFLAGTMVTAAWISAPDQVQVTASWDEADRDARSASAHFKEVIAILVKQSASEPRRLTGFFVDALTSWDAFRQAQHDLGRAVVLRIIFGTAGFYSLQVLGQRLAGLPETLLALADKVEAFVYARECGEIPTLEARVQDLRDAFASVGTSTAYLEAVARYLSFRMGLELPTSFAGSDGIAIWATGLVSATRAELPDLRRIANFRSRVVEKVDQYLKQNLGVEVRVPDIASALGLSPNYLSSVYRRLTQNTISERLTVLRLDYSRELLARPESQIKEVAAVVGYKSTRYFARLYHKRFGHYPSGR